MFFTVDHTDTDKLYGGRVVIINKKQLQLNSNPKLLKQNCNNVLITSYVLKNTKLYDC